MGQTTEKMSPQHFPLVSLLSESLPAGPILAIILSSSWSKSFCFEMRAAYRGWLAWGIESFIRWKSLHPRCLIEIQYTANAVKKPDNMALFWLWIWNSHDFLSLGSSVNKFSTPVYACLIANNSYVNLFWSENIWGAITCADGQKWFHGYRWWVKHICSELMKHFSTQSNVWKIVRRKQYSEDEACH